MLFKAGMLLAVLAGVARGSSELLCRYAMDHGAQTSVLVRLREWRERGRWSR